MIVWLTASTIVAPGHRQLDLAQHLPAGRAQRRGRLDGRRRHLADAQRRDPDRGRDRVDHRGDGRRRRADQEQQGHRREVGERRHDLHDVEDRRDERREPLARGRRGSRAGRRSATESTAASVSASVSMLSSHRPSSPSDTKPPTASAREPPARRPGSRAPPATAIRPGQPSAASSALRTASTSADAQPDAVDDDRRSGSCRGWRRPRRARR